MAAAGKWHTAPVTRSLPLPQVTAAALPALQRRTSAVLVVSQILGGLGVAVGIALAPMLAAEVSGSEALSGLAPTASVIGTALLSLPLAALMTGRGRRAGLVLAYLIGALGGGLVVVATMLPSFPLLLLGMAAFGAGSLAGLQARFAAADLVGPERRGRAISTVVWATTIGSVLGPNISAPASRLFRGTPIPEAAGRILAARAGVGVFVAVALRPASTGNGPVDQAESADLRLLARTRHRRGLRGGDVDHRRPRRPSSAWRPSAPASSGTAPGASPASI
ncbi:hypothetical protein SCALM49S_08943 [Streptomyces californicus]